MYQNPDKLITIYSQMEDDCPYKVVHNLKTEFGQRLARLYKDKPIVEEYTFSFPDDVHPECINKAKKLLEEEGWEIKRQEGGWIVTLSIF